METKFNAEELTLLFIDEKGHFEEEMLEVFPELLFDEIINCETFKELDFFLKAKNNQEKQVLLFNHIRRKEGSQGCKNYKNSTYKTIEHKYPSLEIIDITSQGSGTAEDEIKKQNRGKPNFYTYADAFDSTMEGEFTPTTVRSLHEEMKSSDQETINPLIEPYIFISHSSNDEKLVTSFLKHILKLGLDIPYKNIFYSSMHTTGVNTAKDIPEEVKKALSKMTIFIQYVSDEYKKSEVCLNEMGAAWYKLETSNIIILKSPDIEFNELGFINFGKLALCIDNKEDLIKFAEDKKDIFKDFNLNAYIKEVEDFLKENGF